MYRQSSTTSRILKLVCYYIVIRSRTCRHFEISKSRLWTLPCRQKHLFFSDIWCARLKYLPEGCPCMLFMYSALHVIMQWFSHILDVFTLKIRQNFFDLYIFMNPNKSDKLLDVFDNIQPPELSVSLVDFCESKFSSFQEMTVDDVRKILMTSAVKSSPLDPIPTDLLKRCLHLLLPHFTCVINLSLLSGVMPQSLNIAQVTPLVKKANADRNELKHYRLISIQSQILVKDCWMRCYFSAYPISCWEWSVC